MEGYSFDAPMFLSTSYGISHFTRWLVADGPTHTAAKFLLPNFYRQLQSHKEFSISLS
jgi:hypothetical protein